MLTQMQRDLQTLLYSLVHQVKRWLDNPKDPPGVGDCNKIIFICSNLVFYENDLGVMPVHTNKEFTKIKAAFHTLDFVEYKEENAPLSWQANNVLKKSFR